jgi:DNA (cytosine-5)-methyltransferase 1
MTRPLLLDLFCGAGGAAMGYHRAGFDVVGVDIADQPRYPFDFIRADALGVLRRMDLMRYKWAAIHASPPCQAYSVMSACRDGLADAYPDLVGPVRDELVRLGRPWVIENVPRAPLRNPIVLCGHMFGLKLYRHRLFESSELLMQPHHAKHVVPGGRAGHWKPGQIISVSGNCSPIVLAREAMGIDWMNRDELSEAIPPAYTEFIGSQLMSHVRETAA